MAVWFIQNRDYTGSWQKRYITIRRIEPEAVADGKLVVPREIDGFKVLGIGAWNILTDRVPYEALTSYSGDSLESVVNHYRVLDEIERIEELVLPEGLDFIGSYALEGSRSLLEITFPPDIYVSCFAFGSLPIKTDSVFRPKKIILYSDSVVDIKDYTAIEFLKESKAEIYIRYHNQGQFYYTLSGYVEKIYVDKKIGFFALSSVMGEEDYVDAPPPSYNVKRLIINGKGTSLQFPYYANEPSVNDLSVLDKDGSWISGVKGLYTVRGQHL